MINSNISRGRHVLYHHAMKHRQIKYRSSIPGTKIYEYTVENFE